MTDIYIDVPIETDPQDLLNDAYTYLETVIPGWTPASGQLDVWILMAMASIAAESRDVASVVPANIFRWFGANLLSLPPIDATTATALTKWTAVDNNGYTIPAGTQVAISIAGADPVPFITSVDNVIAPGTTVLDNVLIEAVYPGAAASGLGTVNGPIELLDALTFIASVTQDAVTAGGTDAETDEDYLDRLTAELQLLAPRPILARDFAIYARNTSGVYRAAAIDGYNPLHNLLSLLDASLEASVGDWVNNANATVTQDATFGVDGTHSLKLVSVAAGDMSAHMTNAGTVPVVPGETYTALATVKPAAARTCNITIEWQNASHVVIGTIGNSFAVGAGATVALSTTGTALVGAAFANIKVTVLATAAAGEVANFDKMSLRHGSTTDWVPGGTGETNQPRTVTVSAIDATGAPVSPTVKAAILTSLQAQREVNFVVYVMDAVQSLVDVTASVKALAGWDLPTVQLNVINALNAYLSPSSWGNNPSIDAPQDWTNTTVVRYLEVAQVINQVPGVAYIESLTLGLHSAAPTEAAADLAIPGQFPLADSSTITVTVDP